MDDRQTQLVKSSLSAAVSSLNLAMEIMGGSSREFSHGKREESRVSDRPLMTGIFDGLKATCTDGKVYDVAPIYIVKAGLVVGDTLKLDRLDPRGKAYFLQYKRVKRKKETGVIAKKEGKWVIVTSSGSYKLYPEAVERWQAQEGDEATVLLPEENPQSPYASMETVAGREVHDERREEAVPQKVVVKEEPAKEVKVEAEEKVKEEKEEKKKATAKKETAEKEEKEKSARVVQDDDLR
ncbi:hypothetical protein L6255_00980 [Candidatus Parcubacteria bacterium]|nr:hypothetical protein [Patescibacteria group bacterium]MCG2688995.1 hypothetical protein [Candidatus Parcubacteria bacterium]